MKIFISATLLALAACASGPAIQHVPSTDPDLSGTLIFSVSSDGSPNNIERSLVSQKIRTDCKGADFAVVREGQWGYDNSSQYYVDYKCNGAR